MYYVVLTKPQLANKKCSNNLINTFSLGDWTAYVAFQIIKVNVAPGSRAMINQTHACEFTNIQPTNYPEFPGHGLAAVTGFFFYNLQKYNFVISLVLISL